MREGLASRKKGGINHTPPLLASSVPTLSVNHCLRTEATRGCCFEGEWIGGYETRAPSPLRMVAKRNRNLLRARQGVTRLTNKGSTLQPQCSKREHCAVCLEMGGTIMTHPGSLLGTSFHCIQLEDGPVGQSPRQEKLYVVRTRRSERFLGFCW